MPSDASWRFNLQKETSKLPYSQSMELLVSYVHFSGHNFQDLESYNLTVQLSCTDFLQENTLKSRDVNKYEYILQNEWIMCYKQTQIQLLIEGTLFIFFFFNVLLVVLEVQPSYCFCLLELWVICKNLERPLEAK